MQECNEFYGPSVTAKCDISFVVPVVMKIHTFGPFFADESTTKIIPSDNTLGMECFVNLYIKVRMEIRRAREVLSCCDGGAAVHSESKFDFRCEVVWSPHFA